MGLKNEFEIAVVNETSGFEQLKVYCSLVLPVSLIPVVVSKSQVVQITGSISAI